VVGKPAATTVTAPIEQTAEKVRDGLRSRMLIKLQGAPVSEPVERRPAIHRAEDQERISCGA